MNSDLSALVDEIKQASGAIAAGDSALSKRVDQLAASIDELYRKTSRPGFQTAVDDDADFARKSAVEMCKTRRALMIPKIDGNIADDYVPSSDEID